MCFSVSMYLPKHTDISGQPHQNIPIIKKEYYFVTKIDQFLNSVPEKYYLCKLKKSRH